MKKTLIATPEKCTGCSLCELVCSLSKEGTVNPSRARIHVVHWEDHAVEIPIICQQCEPAPCVTVCPVNARIRDEELGAIKIDYDTCINCKMCLVACPFGSASYDPVAEKVITCDLCDGDPKCVKFCETKALEFVEATAINATKRREAAQKLLELIEKFAE